jgi:hypothetical protein
MTEQNETTHRITYDASNHDSLIVSSDEIQAVKTPPPVIHIAGTNGQPLVSIHSDGRTEFGEGYQPDEAATAFWDAVQRLVPPVMVREYGAPLTARINAELAADEAAKKKLQAITEAVILWRDRPGEGVGLAIALASILDAEKPEPPAATALVRVLRECDRLERAVRNNPTSPEFDGAYLTAVRHIREAAAGQASEGV